MEGPGSWKETRHADLDLKEETQGGEEGQEKLLNMLRLRNRMKKC